MKHNLLLKEIAGVKGKIANTPVAVPCGKYSWESTLCQELGDLGLITDKMILLLGDYARLLGHGEEYQRVVAALAEYKEHLKKRLVVNSTGCDWESAGDVRRRREKQIKPQIGCGVFGLTWKELEEMQGGKLTV